MSIFLLSFVAVFIASPLLSQSQFRAVFDWERRQIALDNAAITLGRGEREIFRQLRQTNQTVAGLELEHHSVHQCARTLTPAAGACGLADEAIEEAIREVHQSAYENASRQWAAKLHDALTEAAKLSPGNISVTRRETVPIQEVRCSMCGQAVAWEVEPGALPLKAKLRQTAIDGPELAVGLWTTGDSLRAGAVWDYRLEPR